MLLQVDLLRRRVVKPVVKPEEREIFQNAPATIVNAFVSMKALCSLAVMVVVVSN